MKKLSDILNLVFREIFLGLIIYLLIRLAIIFVPLSIIIAVFSDNIKIYDGIGVVTFGVMLFSLLYYYYPFILQQSSFGYFPYSPTKILSIFLRKYFNLTKIKTFVYSDKFFYDFKLSGKWENKVINKFSVDEKANNKIINSEYASTEKDKYLANTFIQYQLGTYQIDIAYMFVRIILTLLITATFILVAASSDMAFIKDILSVYYNFDFVVFLKVGLFIVFCSFLPVGLFLLYILTILYFKKFIKPLETLQYLFSDDDHYNKHSDKVNPDLLMLRYEFIREVIFKHIKRVFWYTLSAAIIISLAKILYIYHQVAFSFLPSDISIKQYIVSQIIFLLLFFMTSGTAFQYLLDYKNERPDFYKFKSSLNRNYFSPDPVVSDIFADGFDKFIYSENNEFTINKKLYDLIGSNTILTSDIKLYSLFKYLVKKYPKLSMIRFRDGNNTKFTKIIFILDEENACKINLTLNRGYTKSPSGTEYIEDAELDTFILLKNYEHDYMSNDNSLDDIELESLNDHLDSIFKND